MFRSFARLGLFLPLVFTVSPAQTIIQSSPQAITLASESLQATAGSTALADVTLQGTVNYTAGSDEESGTFTLEVKGNQESKLALNLSGGPQGEIRQRLAGAWIDRSGVQHPMANHNCFVDASTLFPTFSLWGVLNDPQVTATYVEQTSKEGITVDHIRLVRTLSSQAAAMTAEIQGLSAADLYLDAGTHLPVAVDFNIHPDDNLRTNFPVGILLSDYEKVGGILVATHIQKLIQGTVALDFYVSGVTVNSGIQDSDFSVQSTPGVS
jgi:hypothetical protein